MKKLNAFFFGAALGVATLTSCSTDNTDPIIRSFDVTDVNGGDLEPGDSLAITAELVDAEGLARAIMSVQTSAGATIGTAETVELKDAAASFASTFVVPTTAMAGQSYIITLTVEDDNKDVPSKATEMKTVQVRASAVNFTGTTYSNIELQASTSTAANKVVFMDLSTSTTYNVTDGGNNQSVIDLAYFYGSTNGNAIAAPNNDNVNGVGQGSFSFTQGWTAANATTFGTSSLNFDTVSDTEIAGITGLTSSLAANLTVGQVIAFETAAGEKGLIKVMSISADNAGTATFSIKLGN